MFFKTFFPAFSSWALGWVRCENFKEKLLFAECWSLILMFLFDYFWMLGLQTNKQSIFQCCHGQPAPQNQWPNVHITTMSGWAGNWNSKLTITAVQMNLTVCSGVRVYTMMWIEVEVFHSSLVFCFFIIRNYFFQCNSLSLGFSYGHICLILW